MSDSTQSRAGRFYVQDMIQFCERVRAYTAGQDQTHSSPIHSGTMLRYATSN